MMSDYSYATRISVTLTHNFHLTVYYKLNLCVKLGNMTVVTMT